MGMKGLEKTIRRDYKFDQTNEQPIVQDDSVNGEVLQRG